MKKLSPKQFQKAAWRLFHAEGHIEVDDGAHVSYPAGSSEGTYVAAWVWVSREEAAKEKL